MSSVTDKLSKDQDYELDNEQDETEQVSVEGISYSEGGGEDDDDEDEDAEDATDDNERIAIDLSENEVYKGICTLFEDEEGNNILEYISLIHTELIALNKSVEFIRGIKKDISRIADCAEILTKGLKKGGQQDDKKSNSKKQ